MSVRAPSSVLLTRPDPPTADDLSPVLTEAGWIVHHSGDPTASFQLAVIDGRSPEALAECRRLRTHLPRNVPLLLVLADVSPSARLAALEAGADAYLLRPFAPRELLLQVQSLLRLGQLRTSAQQRSDELHLAHQRLQQAYRQIEQELDTARRLQHVCQPLSLPQLASLRLAVHHRASGLSVGRCWDAFRLGEERVAFYLADVLGESVVAGLLSLFLKHIVPAGDALERPDAVLKRLNSVLLEQELPESPFVSMSFATADRKGLLHFARAGQPAPLFVPAAGAPELWPVSGSLLGMFATAFPLQTRQLRPGDKVVFFSAGFRPDGEEDKAVTTPLLACAAAHCPLPIQEFMDRLARDLFSQSDEGLVLLGLEFIAGR